MLSLEQLEARENPATVDLSGSVLTFTGDASADVVTLSVNGGTYTITNSVAFSSVPPGWSGVGTTTTKGPSADVSSIILLGGDGNDVFNIRSTDDPVSIDGESGTDTVNISSNAPTNTGSLDAITGAVSVVGSGDLLTVSDFSAATGNNAIAISGDTITGLAPADIIFTGTFSKVRAITSNTPALAESVTVDSPNSVFQLDTNAGADSVAVLGTAYAFTLNTGAGDDVVTIGDAGDVGGILGAVSIDLGSGANTLTVDDSAGGDHAVVMTSTKITGLAPATINYKAVGGTITANLYCGLASTITFGTLPGTTVVNLFGDWTVV